MTYADAMVDWLEQLAALPEVHDHFIQTCKARELAGRETFGDAYKDRNNIAEAWEETADCANYAFFEVLNRRAEGKDDRMDLALIAAHHAAMAHLALLRLRDTP